MKIKEKWVEIIDLNFVVQSNEMAFRKRGHLGLDHIYYSGCSWSNSPLVTSMHGVKENWFNLGVNLTYHFKTIDTTLTKTISPRSSQYLPY